MRRIKLTKGYSAIVDNEDYEFLNQWMWFAQVTKHTVYAARKPWIKGSNGKSKKIYMHREILSAKSGVEVDHKDGNGLNNRKSNIRIVSRQDNMLNRSRWKKGCSSKFRGVYLDRRDGVWFSSITYNGKTTYLGRFSNEKDASKAYLAKRSELMSDKFIRSGVI